MTPRAVGMPVLRRGYCQLPARSGRLRSAPLAVHRDCATCSPPYIPYIGETQSQLDQNVSDHICNRKGPGAKVIDESADEAITCIYPTCSVCRKPQALGLQLVEESCRRLAARCRRTGFSGEADRSG